MIFYRKSIISFFLLSSPFAEMAHANNTQAILVLDASGSMWGQIDGTSKIEIAREVISNTVGAWDSNQDLGLIAYGHNRKGDCDDIELLIEPKKVDAAAFSATANRLIPKGKTPLSAAVKLAANSMNFKNSKATVILVSDGKETCDLDPCAVGRSLEQAGLDFTAHIIGFDVSKEDSVGLRCLAQETGGAYLDANDAEQLKLALEETRVVVTDTNEDEISSASVTVPIEVYAGSSFIVNWTGPKNVSDYLVVRSEDERSNYAVTYIGRSDIQSPSQLQAPEESGTYFVHYSLKDRRSLAKAKLLVIEPEASVDAPKSVIAGQSFNVVWGGPNNEFDSLRVYDQEGKPQNTFTMLSNDEFSSPSTLTAPVEIGEYEVLYQTLGKNTLAKDSFTVTAAEATVSSDSEVRLGAQFDVQWTGPRNKSDRLRLLDSSGKRMNNYKFVDKEKSPNTIAMIAPSEPGDYFIAYDASSKKILAKSKLKVLPVTAMVTGPKSVSPNAEYQVSWHGPNYKGDSIYTYSEAGRDVRSYKFLGKESSESPITFRAPKEAGNYELRYKIKGGRVLATHSFKVR